MKKIIAVVLAFLTMSLHAQLSTEQEKLNRELFNTILQKKPGRADKVEELMIMGANPNAQLDGKTAMMYVVENYTERVEGRILQYLAEKARAQGELDFIADNGMTALTYAALLGHESPREILVQEGAKEKKKDSYNKNMIDYLGMSKSEKEQRKLALLKKEFTEINMPEEEDWTLIEIGGN